MYTVVLMAALTTTPSTQAWHRGCARGCNGCHGCYAAANTGWYGYGSGCYGCYGCYANPWNAASYSSGSYGPAYGAYGGYGAFHPGVVQCHGCYGAYGGWSGYGYPTQHAVVETAPPSSMPTVPERRPETKPGKVLEEAPLPKVPTPKKNEEQARAKVIVDLPADAKLFVDGQRMNGTSSRRVFQTPELIPGQMYYYELRAEVVRDGQIITANQRLILRPGQSASASFADLGQRRDASARAGGQ